jgi:cation diffusion facilitator family transporter
MSPQRKTALVSIGIVVCLLAVKLVVGIAAGSLGLLSEAAHSGVDLVAALLTFFAVGVASRPADRGHNYGHGKAEHLAALGEAAVLFLLSLLIAWRAISHLVGSSTPEVQATWYALVAIAGVVVVDLVRTVISMRVARRYRSPAIQANALHFASDMVGSLAVLAGLLLVRAGYERGDSAAALLVAVLVLVAAARLMRRNVDVLMDWVPAGAQEAAEQAIAGIDPPVELRRLRMRQAAGRHFADVVIGVSPGAALEQGHAAADAVEAALQLALPESDVIVHVEPHADGAGLRDRAHAAALRVPGVREIHNLTLLSVDGRTEVSLHLKLPGELSLERAHEVATQVEAAIRSELPEVDVVDTHLEPLTGESAGQRPDDADVAGGSEAIGRIVREETGAEPRGLRFLNTDDGLVAYLTLGLEPGVPLSDAHRLASQIEERIMSDRPEISEIIVHTEP